MPRPASDYSPSEIRQRYARLLGERKLSKKLGLLFDENEKQMYRWEANGWPAFTIDFLELLETVPQKNWPKRVAELLDI